MPTPSPALLATSTKPTPVVGCLKESGLTRKEKNGRSALWEFVVERNKGKEGFGAISADECWPLTLIDACRDRQFESRP